MSAAPQNYKNHTKIVPIYHFFALPVAAANAVTLVVRAIFHFSWDTAIAALMGIALVLMFLLARIFALTVQDRVIRLEMRLRLRELLPSDQHPRIAELTRDQLVALRFAGDAELPALARRVLDERLTDRKAIKQLIRDWEVDSLRA
ncbi:MAG TPA: DUF6526 family protein [Vicinamibacterales bacterium]|jgi:hypothetical protein